MNLIYRDTLIQLLELGVQPGGVLLVHTAFSKSETNRGRASRLDLGAAFRSRTARYARHAEHEL